MDRISGLHDDVLVKILSFVPTKLAVSTSILSKRWKFLWMWTTKLEFGNIYYSESQFKSLQSFLDRNLPLHRATVIESFRLKLTYSLLKPEDIKKWVIVAVSRYIRELEIYASDYLYKQIILPSSLYTLKSLVILKLNGMMILLDVPRMVCLPSLKTLELKGVSVFHEASLQRLLSNCPVLEDLLVNLCFCDNMMKKFSVIVPSLHRLSLFQGYKCDFDEFVIDTPSLKYFKLVDHNSHPCLIENMPKLTEAYVDVEFADIKSLIRSITSVKKLTICSKVAYGDSCIFNHLEHLMLRIRKEYSSNLLVRFLEDSPNLRELIFFSATDDHENLGMFSGNQPCTVPECLLSSLKDFTWRLYLGRPQDRNIAVYILKNACHLRSATIISDDTRLVTKLEMITELTRSSRASTNCELNFY